LYDLYSADLYAVCCRYAKDSSEAKDILQDGFIKIFSHLHQYKSIGTLFGWMKKIMVNTALNNLKKNKNLLAKNIEDYQEMHFEEAPILQNIEAKEIMNCFMELPYKYKIVLSMYIIDGYSYSEISTILNLDESSARSRVFRGKVMIQKIITSKISIDRNIKNEKNIK
jgi:RNA polymerase sigma factor (sigma-70 family)